MRYGGWFQIAFESELEKELTSLTIGDRRLLCVKRAESAVEVYDAVCPHRGADLGVGGRLDGCVVQCPYHGHRVALGVHGTERFRVDRLPSLSVGGLVFALVGDFEKGPLPVMLGELSTTHRIFPGWKKTIKVAPELVIENAFDWAHFCPVHDVLETLHGEPAISDGIFSGELQLKVGPSMWQGTEGGTTVDNGNTWLTVPLRARAYSPNLTITQIAVGGGDHPHWVIAAAVPNPDGTSTIRLSIALPLNHDGSVPSRDIADVMLQFESMGLEQDRPVWENLAVNAPSRYTEEDATVLAFRQWCNRFSLNRAAR